MITLTTSHFYMLQVFRAWWFGVRYSSWTQDFVVKLCKRCPEVCIVLMLGAIYEFAQFINCAVQFVD